MLKPKTLEEKYNILVQLIKEYGTYYDKRHGNWVLLHYVDDYYFELDTWNSAISLIRKIKDEPNTMYGIESEHITSIGINWGDFRLYIEEEVEEVLDCYILNIQYDHNLISLHELMCFMDKYKLKSEEEIKIERLIDGYFETINKLNHKLKNIRELDIY